MDNALENLVREIGKDFGYNDLELELGINTDPGVAGSIEYYERLKDGKLKVKMDIDTSRPEEKVVGTIAHEFGHIKSEEYPYLRKIGEARRYLAVPYAIGFFALFFHYLYLMIGTVCVDGVMLGIQETMAEGEARRRGYIRSGLRGYAAGLLERI